MPSFMERFALRWLDLVLAAVATAAIGVWVFAHGSRADEGILGRPLRVGIVSWPGYAAGLVANKGLRPSKDSDFWINDHLLVEFVLRENQTELLSDFARGGDQGGLDVIWSTVDSLVLQVPELKKQGVEARAFMQVDWSRGADAIVATNDIRSIEELKKTRVAVSPAASQWLLDYNLEHSELQDGERRRIRQQQISTGGSKEASGKFIDREVDAAVLWEPDVSRALLERPSSHRLIDTSKANHLIADMMVVDERFIKRRAGVIAAFTRTWLKEGADKVTSDPMLAAQVLMQSEDKFADLGEKTTRELLAKTAQAAIDDNVEMFGLDNSQPLFDDLFKAASTVWLKTGRLKAATDPGTVREDRFLREIYGAPARGCREFATSVLPVAFLPGKAELSPAAQHTLDDEKIALQLRSLAGVRFCVKASPEAGDDLERSRSLSLQREKTVIAYLTQHYLSKANPFVAASADGYVTSELDQATPCMRLKLADGTGPR